jgi:AraC-like DNA-binding protein
MRAVSARALPRHTHDHFGIGVIDQGGHASVSDAGQIEARAGDLIFINPGEVHDGRPLSGLERAWRMLYLDVSLIQDSHADTMDRAKGDFVFPTPVLNHKPFRTIFDSAFAAAVSEDPDQVMHLEENLLQLIAHLGNRIRPSVLPDREIVRRVQAQINDHPAPPMRLQELAAEAGISRYQLHRAFIEHVGLAPHQYILQRRLALARRLIRKGMGLIDVAAIAGFYDQSHLNRSFYRQFGTSPGRY